MNLVCLDSGHWIGFFWGFEFFGHGLHAKMGRGGVLWGGPRKIYLSVKERLHIVSNIQRIFYDLS